MKCLKTRHPVLTYSLFAFFASALFCVFGLSHESYATSYYCELTSPVRNQEYSLSSICTDFDLTSISSPLYFYDYTFTGSSSSMFGDTVQFSFYYSGTVGSGSITLDQFISLGNTRSAPFSDSNIFYSSHAWNGSVYIIPSIKSTSNTTTTVSSFVFKVSDDIDDFASGSSSCPECQVCPTIPDNPYDQKLDNITKAIYVCGAILIMLYFFFCIYKIIVKDGGSR